MVGFNTGLSPSDANLLKLMEQRTKALTASPQGTPAASGMPPYVADQFNLSQAPADPGTQEKGFIGATVGYFKNLGKGMWNSVVDFASSPKKWLTAGAVVVGLAALSIACPPLGAAATYALVGLGLAHGGIKFAANTYNYVKEASQGNYAKADAHAQKAGSGALEAGLAAVGARKITGSWNPLMHAKGLWEGFSNNIKTFSSESSTLATIKTTFGSVKETVSKFEFRNAYNTVKDQVAGLKSKITRDNAEIIKAKTVEVSKALYTKELLLSKPMLFAVKGSQISSGINKKDNYLQNLQQIPQEDAFFRSQMPV